MRLSGPAACEHARTRRAPRRIPRLHPQLEVGICCQRSPSVSRPLALLRELDSATRTSPLPHRSFRERDGRTCQLRRRPRETPTQAAAGLRGLSPPQGPLRSQIAVPELRASSPCHELHLCARRPARAARGHAVPRGRPPRVKPAEVRRPRRPRLAHLVDGCGSWLQQHPAGGRSGSGGVWVRSRILRWPAGCCCSGEAHPPARAAAAAGRRLEEVRHGGQQAWQDVQHEAACWSTHLGGRALVYR